MQPLTFRDVVRYTVQPLSRQDRKTNMRHVRIDRNVLAGYQPRLRNACECVAMSSDYLPDGAALRMTTLSKGMHPCC
jgi:hypothetical protein